MAEKVFVPEKPVDKIPRVVFVREKTWHVWPLFPTGPLSPRPPNTLVKKLVSEGICFGVKGTIHSAKFPARSQETSQSSSRDALDELLMVLRSTPTRLSCSVKSQIFETIMVWGYPSWCLSSSLHRHARRFCLEKVHCPAPGHGQEFFDFPTPAARFVWWKCRKTFLLSCNLCDCMEVSEA